MDLINKKNVSGIKIGQKARQVARFIKHRTRGDFDPNAHFISYDMGQCSFSQSGRAM